MILYTPSSSWRVLFHKQFCCRSYLAGHNNWYRECFDITTIGTWVNKLHWPGGGSLPSCVVYIHIGEDGGGRWERGGVAELYRRKKIFNAIFSLVV